MENDENIYRINLEKSITASALIYDLSTYLEMDDTKNKKILLQMNDIDLNVAQLKSIRSLINSINSSLSFISTKSQITKESAMALEIIITDEDVDKTMLEPEKTYMTVDELLEEKEENLVEEVKEADVKSSIISIETEDFSNQDAQDALEALFEEKQTVDNTNVDVKNESEVVEKDDKKNEEKSDLIDPLDRIYETEKTLESIMNVKDSTEDVEDNKGIEYYKNLDNEFTEDDLEIDTLQTMYIKHTLRSGQVVNFDGNVVIIGDCHTGSEVHATGDITVWGVLSGIAQAGSNGNIKAKIRALKMNAIQLRIADSFARKPDALNSVLMEKTNTFTPEEARFIDGNIVIFKVND